MMDVRTLTGHINRMLRKLDCPEMPEVDDGPAFDLLFEMAVRSVQHRHGGGGGDSFGDLAGRSVDKLALSRQVQELSSALPRSVVTGLDMVRLDGLRQSEYLDSCEVWGHQPKPLPPVELSSSTRRSSRRAQIDEPVTDADRAAAAKLWNHKRKN